MSAVALVVAALVAVACLLATVYNAGRADGIREADARWIRIACDLDLYPRRSCPP